jgi:glyoxylase-like metal-dependent hydrolase (beta-lactamase superfamily II)
VIVRGLIAAAALAASAGAAGGQALPPTRVTIPRVDAAPRLEDYLPGGDHATLLASIRTVLFGFGDDATVHPGHGPSTTIGQERRTNPFLT